MNFNLSQNGKEVKTTQKRKKFSTEEDKKLKDLVKLYGVNNWTKIANEMEGRNERQCRNRYVNYLSQDISITEKDSDNMKKFKISLMTQNKQFCSLMQSVDWKKEIKVVEDDSEFTKMIKSCIDNTKQEITSVFDGTLDPKESIVDV